MHIIKLSLIGLIISLMMSVVASPALAACPAGKTELSPGVCVAADPIGFASDIYGYGLGLIGGVAVLFVMYGGYLILSSQGDPNKIHQGRSYIFFSIVGIILAVSGLAVYQVIGGDILKIPGFG